MKRILTNFLKCLNIIVLCLALSCNDSRISETRYTQSNEKYDIAFPVIALWIYKAALATTVDAFLNAAIAAVTGIPVTGADTAIDFATNLIPGSGEARSGTKLAKLYKAIDRIAEAALKFKKLKIPGAKQSREVFFAAYNLLKLNIQKLDFDGAKKAFSNMIGYLRELQVMTLVDDFGFELKRFGGPKSSFSDWDGIISSGSSKRIGLEIKSGSELDPNKTGFINWVKKLFGQEADVNARIDDLIGKLKQKINYDEKVDSFVYIVDSVDPKIKNALQDEGVWVFTFEEFQKAGKALIEKASRGIPPKVVVADPTCHRFQINGNLIDNKGTIYYKNSNYGVGADPELSYSFFKTQAAALNVASLSATLISQKIYQIMKEDLDFAKSTEKAFGGDLELCIDYKVGSQVSTGEDVALAFMDGIKQGLVEFESEGVVFEDISGNNGSGGNSEIGEGYFTGISGGWPMGLSLMTFFGGLNGPLGISGFAKSVFGGACEVDFEDGSSSKDEKNKLPKGPNTKKKLRQMKRGRCPSSN
ncbi:MAG: hypothetical protein H6621_11110 [Halobacteriovoraceae bacterium]|nr:hypothetical protein [Halobacteriovoraceae bacterium]MCB9095607.1 hypothetical protein [Halobacteriovoraceae bacterium]